jgi:hypothetical protein
MKENKADWLANPFFLFAFLSPDSG